MSTYGFIVTDTFIPCALDVLVDHPDVSGSHHIKHEVYRRAFNIPFRHKYTGFEYIPSLDAEYREKFERMIAERGFEPNRTTVSSVQASDIINKIIENEPVSAEPVLDDSTVKSTEPVLDDSPEANIERYRNELIRRAKNYGQLSESPVIYYSGGGDSEMVIQSFLAAKVDFMAVAFLFAIDRELVDDIEQLESDMEEVRHDIPVTVWRELRHNEVFLNLPEVVHAFRSSNQNRFNLAVRVIDIKEVWDSELILEALGLNNITSPMILTQRMMTGMVNKEISQYSDKYLKTTMVLRYEL